MREMLGRTTPQELHDCSLQACARMADTREYQQAEIIMVFLSLPTELDTTPLVMRAWRDRKRILAPKVSWEQRRMMPIEVRSLSDEEVKESPLGIREPVQGVPFPVANIDLVLVPGLGFDEHGNRIGRGRGFYDQFLAHRDWKGIACGFAFEKQVLAQVPMDERDMQVDMLVTDAAVRRFGAVARRADRVEQVSASPQDIKLTHDDCDGFSPVEKRVTCGILSWPVGAGRGIAAENPWLPPDRIRRGEPCQGICGASGVVGNEGSWLRSSCW